MQSDGLNSALSPVVYGDIALSIKNQGCLWIVKPRRTSHFLLGLGSILTTRLLTRYCIIAELRRKI